MKTKKCSIIIRTKNEERWITYCLKSIFEQDYKNFEIILVDNNSTDQTVKRAKEFKIKKIIKIDNFLPGKALNMGIRASKGDYIVCISGHCIPKNNKWLSSLVYSLEESDEYAGVYGKQEPMSFSKPSDIRDLITVFGLDKKVQIKENFFHNANSIIRRSNWELVNFNESLTNVEDRIWGKEMIERKFKLVYEPNAIVYHHHGIHHDGDQLRSASILKVIEKYDSNLNKNKINVKKLNIYAIIPFKGDDSKIGKESQLSITIQHAKKSKYISKIFVTTDSKLTQSVAIKNKVEVPFLRTNELSKDYIGTNAVLEDTINKLVKKTKKPDLIVYLEPTFPFRQVTLIDDMIDTLIEKGASSIIAAKNEYGAIWQRENNKFDRLDEGDIPRKFKSDTYLAYKGLCYVFFPDAHKNLENDTQELAFFKVDDPLSCIEIRDTKSRKAVNLFFK